jgi:Haloacid dehalogenase-like hydrolase
MLKAVIFDIDGTLIDSVDLHARSWVDAFARFGIEIKFEDVRPHIREGADRLIPAFAPPGTPLPLPYGLQRITRPSCGRNVFGTSARSGTRSK